MLRAMSSSAEPQGIRVFLAIWLGQVVSMFGSGLTGFALGVWVYQTTESVTRFALIALFSSLPTLLLSPVAGALVDRWDRRWAMILSDAGAGLCTVAIALLLWTDRLEIWHLYVILAISSIFGAFQWPAFSASLTMLVPRRHLGRAAGLFQMIQVAALLAPLAAGALLARIGLRGILLIDVSTFVVATLILLAVRIPRPEVSAARAGESVAQSVVYGWRYLQERPGLMALLLVFVGTNFTGGMVQALLTPMVLSFASAAELGRVVTVAGAGMLLGSVTMSLWGGPQRRVLGILGAMLLQGTLLTLGGLRESLPVIAGVAFAFLFLNPVVNTCSQAIWQSKVAPELQGRVFAIRRMVAMSAMPLAFALAGPLADRVFEPLLAPGGALAETVGAVIGVGKGRGIAFLFMLLGVGEILGLVAACSYGPLRRVDEILPDVSPGA